MSNKWTLKRLAVGAVVAAVVLGGGALAYGAAMPARSSVDAQLSAALAADPGTDPGAQGSSTADTRQAAKQALQDCRLQHAGDRAAMRQCVLDVRKQFAGRLPGPKVGPALRLGAVVHGDLIVRKKDGTFQSVTIDRGKVQSVEGDKLTIVRADGPTVVLTLDANTKYRGISGPQDLTKDTQIGVASRDGNALMVNVPKRAGANAKKGA